MVKKTKVIQISQATTYNRISKFQDNKTKFHDTFLKFDNLRP